MQDGSPNCAHRSRQIAMAARRISHSGGSRSALFKIAGFESVGDSFEGMGDPVDVRELLRRFAEQERKRRFLVFMLHLFF
jgi:hypothetical protein